MTKAENKAEGWIVKLADADIVIRDQDEEADDPLKQLQKRKKSVNSFTNKNLTLRNDLEKKNLELNDELNDEVNKLQELLLDSSSKIEDLKAQNVALMEQLSFLQPTGELEDSSVKALITLEGKGQ